MSHGTGFYAEIEKLFRPAEHAFFADLTGFATHPRRPGVAALLRDVGAISREWRLSIRPFVRRLAIYGR
ncbi:hypothetical protein PUN4_70041 [Paraburkholderia unamae]|nr:hypothetical protein PUN4_70041 [Paraburkholderia unamae]